MKRRIAYICIAVLCLTAVAAAMTAGNGKSDPPFPFTTVTPQELSAAGVTLGPASNPGLAIAQSVANSHASDALGQASVRESHLMHCTDTQDIPNVDHDCFVVSVDPSVIPIESLPSMPIPAPMKWAVVLVNSATGDVIAEKASNQ